jgi:hypothetical protein
MRAGQRIALSLISHTNVGKTTLARTLLRRDVGDIRDSPHVTDIATSHVLMETAAGDSLVLWDTPGFGDSARLLKRLRSIERPLGWFLSEVWDRFADRPFFSSQQAIRNVRDEADVVLYLVNAAEDPGSAGYVDAEMAILGWVDKPLILLLNQTGPPDESRREEREAERWMAHLAAFPFVKAALPLDAFARCWVQEQQLLAAIEPQIESAKQAAFAALEAAWLARDLGILADSSRVLAKQLATAARDIETLPNRRLGNRALAWLRNMSRNDERPKDPAIEAAMERLAERLDGTVRTATAELLELHGLDGAAASEVLARIGDEYAVEQPADETRAGIIGGAVSGALGGVAADLAASGLTFGAGALIGGVVGALGASGATRAYNLASGREASTVRWSRPFLNARAQASIVRYLAVAHFGRGRGEYVETECPPHWPRIVAETMKPVTVEIEALWKRLTDDAAVDAEQDLATLLRGRLSEVLARLYPSARALLASA